MLHADFKNAIMREARLKFLLHDALPVKLKIKSALLINDIFSSQVRLVGYYFYRYKLLFKLKSFFQTQS